MMTTADDLNKLFTTYLCFKCLQESEYAHGYILYNAFKTYIYNVYA